MRKQINQLYQRLALILKIIFLFPAKRTHFVRFTFFCQKQNLGTLCPLAFCNPLIKNFSKYRQNHHAEKSTHPADHADQILEKVMKRAWTKKTSLTKAVAIVAHNHIRHELTDYESLLQISPSKIIWTTLIVFGLGKTF
jgi:hypothetical protein